MHDWGGGGLGRGVGVSRGAMWEVGRFRFSAALHAPAAVVWCSVSIMCPETTGRAAGLLSYPGT
eukprot:8931986-Prorocentrum_lima.AAC.1